MVVPSAQPVSPANAPGGSVFGGTPNSTTATLDPSALSVSTISPVTDSAAGVQIPQSIPPAIGMEVAATPIAQAQESVLVPPSMPVSPVVPDPVLLTPAPPATEGTEPPSPAALPTPPVGPVQSPVSAQGILDILVTNGKLTAAQADAVRLEAAQRATTHEDVLISRQFVSETDLLRTKAETLNIPFVQLDETGVSPEALTVIPESVARRYQMLPFTIDKAERTIAVAMKNPLDLGAIDFVEKKTGYKLTPHFAIPSQIEQKIVERYSQSISSEVTAALKETSQAQGKQIDSLSALSREVIREAPIAKIVETILAFAVQARASDVHIEPLEDRTRVRYRIDGILAEKLVLPRNVHDALVSRVKILSELKIDEKRVPQDGRFTFTANGQAVDLRVSTLPTVHGEKIVMRLLQKNLSVPSLTDLGLRGLALKNMEESVRVPHGIILITGPTGSGKTTTLYSILHKINTPKVNIVTLEDPVEYQMPGINQVQINPQAGLTFASGLRSFLRQDPNIIMVGEIRDSETAELAVQASLTGHLVFSTLHTNSAAGALPRLIDMGAEPFLLASSITVCASQRVCRRLNQSFKEKYTAEPEVVEDIKQVLGPLFNSWCAQQKVDPNGPVELYRPVANRPDNEPEYKGRIAIFEVLKMTEEIGKMVIERRPAADIEAIGLKSGMLLMKQDGYLKALEGITTLEEVMRVAEV